MAAGTTAGWDTRFQDLFSAIDEGYCLCEIVVDADGEAVDYRFLEANANFEEMTGLVDPVGKTARELVPDLEAHWVRVYARAALGGERLRFELGSEAMGRWFDVFTMPVGGPGQFAIVFKDETRRRQSLEALRVSEERYRELAEQERRISVRLQKALLPDRLVAHPDVRIGAYYAAGSELLDVGGDWYDTFLWPDGRVGAMVGDVVGHGVEAAAAMGRLRAGVAALASQSVGGAHDLIAALAACAGGPNGADYVTASAVVLDPGDGLLSYSRAGHPPTLLLTPGKGCQWLDDAQSPPAGRLLPIRATGLTRAEGHVVVEPGTSVVMYSDGLVERRGESISVGLARLQRTLAGLAASDPADLSRTIAESMARDLPALDDVVVVCMQFRPQTR